jgi:hypothetical protein
LQAGSLDDTVNNGSEPPVHVALVPLRHGIPDAGLPGEPGVVRAWLHALIPSETRGELPGQGTGRYLSASAIVLT